MRKRDLTLGAIATGLALIALPCALATAQDWPTRPVTMVIPFAPGGALDVIGRILAPHLSEVLGQQVVIENVSGAGGMIGVHRVAKAAPDGYQFVLGGVGTHAQSQALFKKPLYNAATDFAPVALIADQPIVLIARKDLPANNLQEFIAYAKANQARMQYGSGGAGSAVHLACALLNVAIGINVTHIAYRGGLPAMQDLIAGRIDYQCPNAAAAIPQLKNRQVKAITALTPDRSSVLPHLASAREQGLKNFGIENWVAMFAPKGTPKAMVSRMNEAVVAVVNRPAAQERLRELGVEAVAPERRSPEYLQELVEIEIKKWADVIKASGLAMN